MPPPRTKTPDPPATIGDEICSEEYGRADCFSLGYQDGYWRGYERAYDDFHGGTPDKRRNVVGINAGDRKKIPGKCKHVDRQECFEKGYTVGYEKGYEAGANDSADA